MSNGPAYETASQIRKSPTFNSLNEMLSDAIGQASRIKNTLELMFGTFGGPQAPKDANVRPVQAGLNEADMKLSQLSYQLREMEEFIGGKV